MANNIKTYSYHFSFLKKFPELACWLDFHGFTVMHSHKDFKMNIVYTFWADYTSDIYTTGINDAQHFLMIVYCQNQNTIDVYQQIAITTQLNEKSIINGLEQIFRNTSINTKITEGDDIFYKEYPIKEFDDFDDDSNGNKSIPE